MKVKFKLKKITEKVLVLDIQKKYLKQMVEDFKKQGWEAEVKILK